LKDHKGLIVNNIKLNDHYYLLSIKIDDDPKELGLAGQFYELKVKSSQRFRVPISIYDIHDNIVDFMIKDIGKATHELSLYKKNDSISVLGPLGKPFTEAINNQKCLLITGGVGYAPLNYFKNTFPHATITWFHGGANKDEVFPADRIYTNDGSEGIKGFVTLDLEQYLKENMVDRILTCGPRIMMKNIVQIALPYVKDIEVSLEEYMACGIGVCFGCAVKIKNGEDFLYKTVCKDGPIFQGSEVIWDE